MGFEIWYPMFRPGVGDKHFLPPANEVWGKVIFSVACVKNSVHGGSASVHAGIPHPPSDQTPPRPDIPSPPGPGPAPDHAPPEQTPPPGPGTPCAVYAGRYGQQAGGMHPTGLQSCLEYLIWQNAWFTENLIKISHKFPTTCLYILTPKTVTTSW